MSTRGFIGYKHNNEIHGWYNHSDSYPSYLGEEILKNVYCKYTWKQIKDFFLNKLKLINQEGSDGSDPVYAAHKNILEQDWTEKGPFNLEDGLEFYKDGLFCEYSYIFDLDSKKKKLMFFKGFGKRPCKNYEDWFYTSDNSEKFYITPKGTLTGEHTILEARIKMYGIYKFPKFKKLFRMPDTDIPLLINRVDDFINKNGWKVEYQKSIIKDILTEYIEYRLKKVA